MSSLKQNFDSGFEYNNVVVLILGIVGKMLFTCQTPFFYYLWDVTVSYKCMYI